MKLSPLSLLSLAAVAVQAQALPNDSTTAGISRPKAGPIPYGTSITTCNQPGTLALTFDDGPGAYTPQLLDILDELQVKATFFIIGTGHEDAASAAVLRRMYNAGHQLASHTYSHQSLNGPSRWTDVTANEAYFRNIFGFFPTYIRPPYLECNQECLNFLGERGYHVISADVDTKDFEHDDPVGIEASRRLFSEGVSSNPAGNGHIVLAHDIHANTVTNLARFMVEESHRLGYRLVTVGECLGDSRDNWYRQAGEAPRSY
ncbi:hypothetical protein XA68_17755 [Ophiocordyceps unilateralis]|uniref:NodB homology domain-containing protein n=1 Tax=Ophiocordyceps unilateralis TaxID=268505 RepID=A0A2A9PQG6_OPHUN|nr:hypothetical protein XA68_17755 [Ophiocordyceps unilateralis]